MKNIQLKLYILCFIPAIFFEVTTAAQQVASIDTAVINSYNRLSEKLQERNTDSALLFSTKALFASEAINFQQGRLTALNNSGWIYYRKGNYQRAIQMAFEAITIAEKLKNYYELAKSYNTIGSVYNDQGVTEKSIEFFYHSLSAYKQANNQTGIGRALNNLAYTAFKSKRLDSAIYFGEQAYAHNNLLEDKYFFAFTLRTLGDIYNAKSDTAKAMSYLFEALKYSNRSQNHFLTISILNRLGIISDKRNHADSSLYYYKSAEQLANKYGFRSVLVQPYEGLAKLYSRKKDFRNAYLYETAFSKLNDSLKNASTTETIANLQFNYEKEKRETEISLLKKDKDLQLTRVTKQQQFIVTLLIIVLLIVAFLVFLFRRYNFEKKYSYKISQQADELAIVNKELTENLGFKNKMLSILSHDLRSPLGTLLAMIQLLDLGALSPEEYQMIKEKISRQLKALNITLDNLLNWALTQTSSAIKPVPEKINLAELVENNLRLFETMSDEKKLAIRYKPEDQVFATGDKNHVNVVIRNLLLNAIKFSFDAGIIEIKSQQQGDTVTLTITDHGTGIPSEKQTGIFNNEAHFTSSGTRNEKGTGLGLLLCKEFIELNKGHIGFESYPSKGSSFYFSLPKFEE